MAQPIVRGIPTDTEILALRSVPTETAARYIGMSHATLTLALKQERAPFGFAVYNEVKDQWTYNISPGLLVAYKQGNLPTYKLDEVIKLFSEGAERVIDAKLSGVRTIADALGKAMKM